MPYVKVGKSVKSTANKYTVDINTSVNCQSKNLIYLLECKKCRKQYKGETERTLQDRLSDHLGYVRNAHLTKATGFHFNQPGHKISDMQITITEKSRTLGYMTPVPFKGTGCDEMNIL